MIHTSHMICSDIIMQKIKHVKTVVVFLQRNFGKLKKAMKRMSLSRNIV